jgi:hypothetical protein
MDVFVIPIGLEKYELYCEQPAEVHSPDEPAPTGIVGKIRHRIKAFMRKAEEHHHRRDLEVDHQQKGWLGRLQDHAMAWVAERVEEQRLLWNLQGQTTATAAHPQDMPFDQVLTLIRRILQHDYDRHRRWMIIDGIAFVLTFVLLGPLFLLVPGIANLPALYFGFRTVGHFLSMRGARHGLTDVEWTSRPCPPLAELRDVVVLDPPVRAERIHDIAARLRLQRLATFFDRVAIHA